MWQILKFFSIYSLNVANIKIFPQLWCRCHLKTYKDKHVLKDDIYQACTIAHIYSAWINAIKPNLIFHKYCICIGEIDILWYLHNAHKFNCREILCCSKTTHQFNCRKTALATDSYFNYDIFTIHQQLWNLHTHPAKNMLIISIHLDTRSTL